MARAMSYVPEDILSDGVKMPHDLEAERALLGSIIQEEKHLNEAQDLLDLEDWYLEAHRRIWRKMLAMREEASAIDIVTICSELDAAKELNAVGGRAYVCSLTEGLPRRPSVVDYVKTIADKSLLRKLIKQSIKTIHAAEDQSEWAVDLVSSEVQNLENMTAANRFPWKPKRNREILVDAMKFASQNDSQVDWAVHRLIQRGGNGLILADPKVGKSLMMVDLALHLISGTPWLGQDVTRRMRVALVSREDHHGETARRIKTVIAGSELATLDLDGWLWLNTRAQSPTFNLKKRAT